MDIDVSQIKGLLKKAGVLKNYMSLIVPAAIILVAVGIFFFSGIMKGKLQGKIQRQSIMNGARRVDSLLSESVSVDQWKIEKEYQQSFAADANLASRLTKSAGKRELLAYDIFPEPNDPSISVFRQFGKSFMDHIDTKIKETGGTPCPTEIEIAKNIQLASRSSSDVKINTKSVDELDPVNATIIDVICKDRANSGKYYVNKGSISGYWFWKNFYYEGLQKAIADCWSYQLAYWIIEDVLDSIELVNQDAPNILSSAVKKLNYISFTQIEKEEKDFDESDYDSSAEDTDKPQYAPDSAGIVAPSFTGRATGDELDVTQFVVDVVIDSRDILKFMDALSSAKEHRFFGFDGLQPEQKFKHNLITILSSTTYNVDENSESNRFCRFGSDPVVGLKVICEYAITKESYQQIRPAEIEDFMLPGDRDRD